jgi:hypothetical protein
MKDISFSPKWEKLQTKSAKVLEQARTEPLRL